MGRKYPIPLTPRTLDQSATNEGGSANAHLRFKSFRPKELTDFGALSLLTGLVPYLNKRESINRESMAIDSRFPHERPPAEEPLAKCHKLDPKMLR